ncbi:octopamine receptor beta-2R-like [Patiria miniata]|uniref:G-protein coupled receptors family 1 profile domain-containing protein n=1 Tax=Patiria miniata TaxID=46514 RepID=A0A914BN38_PATMI|nr:octopamine receptor beta-2R-like [Patiria miniata]
MNPDSVNFTELLNGEPNPQLDAYEVFVCVLSALTVVLILTLNPICLVVLHRASGIQETTKVFMASLTVSDICIGLFWVLPDLTQYFNRKWVLGSFLCTAIGVASTSLGGLSMFSLLLLTVDRFVAIVYSLRYPTLVTLKKAKTIVAITWSMTLTFSIIAFGIFLPYVISPSAPRKCIVASHYNIYTSIVVSAIAISLVTIFILYMYILNVARQQARRIASQNQISVDLGDQNAPQRVSTKSATTVFIITMTVFICWTMSIIYTVTFSISEAILPPNFGDITDLIFATNSWLNVVIYYLRNRELRQTLHELIASCFHRGF